MNKFTAKKKQELKKKGYLIFSLTGKSLSEMGNKVYSHWHKGEDFEKEKGRKIEVALNPNSELKYNLSFDGAVKESNKPTGIDGTKYEILSISEYVELNNLYYKKTKKELSGWYSWTITGYGDGDRLVGGHSVDGGLAGVRYGWSDFRVSGIGFRPLVVADSLGFNI